MTDTTIEADPLRVQILQAIEYLDGAASESSIRIALFIPEDDGEAIHRLGTALTHLLRLHAVDVVTQSNRVPRRSDPEGERNRTLYYVRKPGLEALARVAAAAGSEL